MTKGTSLVIATRGVAAAVGAECFLGSTSFAGGTATSAAGASCTPAVAAFGSCKVLGQANMPAAAAGTAVATEERTDADADKPHHTAAEKADLVQRCARGRLARPSAPGAALLH